MMKTGAERIRRILAALLMTAVLLTGWVMPASALERLEEMTLNVMWTDAQGYVQTAPAMLVGDGTQPTWWVTVDAAALGSTLTVEVLHPDPDYRFYTLNGTSDFVWLPEDDAASLDDQYAQYIGYDYQGMFQNAFLYLYVSSQPAPEEVFTGGQTSSAVRIPVYYVTEDGMTLDTQYVDVFPGQTADVWASSNAVNGFELTGSNYAQVYVDGSGYANQSQVVFTYRAEQPAVTEAPPAQASVPVYYYHVNGTLLDEQWKTFGEGMHTVYPESSKVSQYRQIGDLSVPVTVYGDGSTDLASVTFYYEDIYVATKEAVVTVYYYHENGALLDMQEKTFTEGTYTIYPESSAVGGYELTGANSAAVTVYSDGSTDVASVTFLYKDVYVAPKEAVVTVYYYHENGTLLDMQEKTFAEGTYTIYPESSKVGGYELTGANSAAVTVYSDGSTDAASVTFFYKDVYVAPAQASVPVYYYHVNGTLLDEQWKTFGEGTHTVIPESSKVGQYQQIGDLSVNVTVYGDGSTDLASVTFYYEDVYTAPVEAIVTVYYKHENGTLLDIQDKVLYAGEQVIRPESSKVSGYQLSSEGSLPVTVYDDGSTNVASVTFWYKDKTAPSAEITVIYQLSDTTLIDQQIITRTPGTHTIVPESSKTGGMTLTGAASVSVYVDNGGAASPNPVVFTYQAPQAQTATVRVLYKDSMGREIAGATTKTLTDGVHAVYPEPQDLPAGYELFTGVEEFYEITVRSGKASRQEVTFYYQKSAAPTATPTAAPTMFSYKVYYYDTSGKQIAAAQPVQLTAGGFYEVRPDAVVPDGYELMSDAVLYVSVGADGTLTMDGEKLAPEDLGFFYRPVQKTVTITVVYADMNGRTIAGPYQKSLAVGMNHTITAEAAWTPAGYDPETAEPATVYVSQDGMASPAYVTLFLDKAVVETPIPVGAPIHRYGVVNDNKVAFRSEPTSGTKSLRFRVNKNAAVYMLSEEYDNKGQLWAKVMIDGEIGYMMSQFLDVMTQRESDRYAASVGATPVPTDSPTPSPTPTASPSPTPTEAFVEIITPPVQSTQPPYRGYAMTTAVTALRTGMSSSDISIIQRMESGTLLLVETDQLFDNYGGQWSLVQHVTGGQQGYVRTADLTAVSEQTAADYIRAWQQQNAPAQPTAFETNTPRPDQVQGYAYAIGDYVPFRSNAYEYANILDTLNRGEVVYVARQTWVDDAAWHYAEFGGQWGYVRSDLVRMMSPEEENAYLSSFGNPIQPDHDDMGEEPPITSETMSSYGYVDASSVNFREGASMGAKRIRELKRYAMCLVIGTEQVNGVTWYKVRYGEQEGYIHGDFFRQMTIDELSTFLNSDEYLQGLRSNSASGSTGSDDQGFTGPGGQVPMEDQTVNQWQDPNSGIYVEYPSWKPNFATPQPVNPTNIPTLEPMGGWQPAGTASPTPSPSPTQTAGFVTDVTYPMEDNHSSGGSALIVVLVIMLVLLGGGGVYAFVRYQQRKRRIAMRAAQRRAASARSAAASARPYARPAGAPRTGMYTSSAPDGSGYRSAAAPARPAAPSSSSGYTSGNPYAGYESSRSVWTQGVSSDTGRTAAPSTGEMPPLSVGSSDADGDPAPRPNRRSAYRRQQQEQDGNGYNE